MRILLTGADGFLGNNITRELLVRGYEVTALLGPHRQIHALEGLPIKLVDGNITNMADMESAVEGCDAIIHAAATTSVWPTRNKLSWKVNVEGTRNIIALALKFKIKRLVYVGTANSFGFGSQELPGDENLAYACAKYKLDYMDSKYAAQQEVLKAVKEQKLPAVVVNPCFMFGPYDVQPGPGAMIVSISKNEIPGFTVGGRNYAAVKDVAKAVVNALSMGRIGECYILGNSNLSYKEIFSLIAEATQSKKIERKIPSFFAKLYGSMNSICGKLCRTQPKVSYALAQIACDYHYYSSAKAIKELHLEQSDLSIAVSECYTWMKANGKLN